MSSALDPQLQKFIEVQTHNLRFQEQVHSLTDKCWERCMDKPSTKLSGTNEKCISNCVNRFIDANNFVLQRLSDPGVSGSSSASSEESFSAW